jgi:hypothetical protein
VPYLDRPRRKTARYSLEQLQLQLGTESFASLYIPCWTDASRTSRATISGGSCFNVLTVRLSDLCLFVADSFHWTGHKKLWVHGVHHRDVSAFNLMYKRREDDTIVGMLNDYELAVLGGSQSTNTERTGTMPFMALDILSSIAADTPQVHLYQHDVESFLWVPIWVCGTYEGGKERLSRPGPKTYMTLIWTPIQTPCPYSSIPPPIPSILSLRSACLYHSRVMYHSCSLIRSFRYHMLATSFRFFCPSFQDCSPNKPFVFVLLVLQSWNQLDFRFPLPLALVVASDARPSFRSSSRDMSISDVLARCRTHLPRVGPPCRFIIPQPARHPTMPYIATTIKSGFFAEQYGNTMVKRPPG